MNIQEQNSQRASVMENLSQCQVCCMTFNETNRSARVLHCGHTFCLQCVENVHKYGNSAHLECPWCRTETKCDLEAIPTNFLVMEMIRKLGVLGAAELASAPQREPKRDRVMQREHTIDEMVDEKYRLLIADVKAELMAKFEELREGLRKSTIQSVQSELEELTESVLEAVRDAYDGLTDSDEDNEDEEDTEGVITASDAMSVTTFTTARSNGETETGSSDDSSSSSTSTSSSVVVVEHQRAMSPCPSVMSIDNPMRSSNDELSDETSDDNNWDCDDEASEDDDDDDEDESSYADAAENDVSIMECSSAEE